jgi:hypothetical protein
MVLSNAEMRRLGRGGKEREERDSGNASYYMYCLRKVERGASEVKIGSPLAYRGDGDNR